MSSDQKRGVWYALATYSLWGIFPLYFHLLAAVPPIVILANRMVWSLAAVAIILLMRRDWAWLRPAMRNRRALLIYLAAALILTVNWYTYIWAVNDGFVVEASLGYFINPLASVLLAVVFLHERLRTGQWGAIGLATAGVIFLAVTYGHLPWIALTLAVTFAFYGLLKKRAPLGSVEGLSLETAFMFLPAAAFLLYIAGSGQGSPGQNSLATNLLLISTGFVTVVPLAFFASAARRIPLTVLGLLQYVSPTLQFIIGVWVFHEPFDLAKLIGFSIIWVALLLYWMEGIANSRRSGKRLPQQPVLDA